MLMHYRTTLLPIPDIPLYLQNIYAKPTLNYSNLKFTLSLSEMHHGNGT